MWVLAPELADGADAWVGSYLTFKTMTLRIFWLDLRRNAAISMPIKQAAQGLITGRDVSDGILNMVEMAFRAHDPCYGCAVHTPPGQMPLDLRMYDSKGGLLNRFQRP